LVMNYNRWISFRKRILAHAYISQAYSNYRGREMPVVEKNEWRPETEISLSALVAECGGVPNKIREVKVTQVNSKTILGNSTPPVSDNENNACLEFAGGTYV